MSVTADSTDAGDLIHHLLEEEHSFSVDCTHDAIYIEVKFPSSLGSLAELLRHLVDRNYLANRTDDCIRVVLPHPKVDG